MKTLFITSLTTFLPSLACAADGSLSDKASTFFKFADTQTFEFHTAIDMVIVVTMAVIGAVHAFFG